MGSTHIYGTIHINQQERSNHCGGELEMQTINVIWFKLLKKHNKNSFSKPWLIFHCNILSSLFTGPASHPIESAISITGKVNLLQCVCDTPAFFSLAMATATGGHCGHTNEYYKAFQSKTNRSLANRSGGCPQVNREIDTTEIITFPQTTYAGDNKTGENWG